VFIDYGTLHHWAGWVAVQPITSSSGASDRATTDGSAQAVTPTSTGQQVMTFSDPLADVLASDWTRPYAPSRPGPSGASETANNSRALETSGGTGGSSAHDRRTNGQSQPAAHLPIQANSGDASGMPALSNQLQAQPTKQTGSLIQPTQRQQSAIASTTSGGTTSRTLPSQMPSPTLAPRTSPASASQPLSAAAPASLTPPPPLVTGSIVIYGTTINLNEGSSINGVIATAKDTTGKNDMATDNYNGTIQWGDGSSSPASFGTTLNPDGTVNVLGSHTYTNDEGGSATISITISDADGNDTTGTGTTTVYFKDAPLQQTQGVSFEATAGVRFEGPVAIFHDSNPNADIADFSGTTIDWGDGAGAQPALRIEQNPDPSDPTGFVVIGSYTYAAYGSPQVKVHVVDVGGQTIDVTSNASVYANPDPAPTGTPSLPPQTTPDTGSGTGADGSGGGSLDTIYGEGGTGSPTDQQDNQQPDNNNCTCDHGAVLNAANSDGGGSTEEYSGDPVRFADGTLKLTTTDVESTGFGIHWGQSRSWTNMPGYWASGSNGSGNVDLQLPYLRQNAAGNEIIVITNGTDARYFDQNGSTYTPRMYLQETLTHDTANQQFVLTDTQGDVIRFWDFTSTLPASQQGQFQSFTDPAGNVTAVVSRNAAGQPTEVHRSGNSGGIPTVESYLYAYYGSGPNTGQLAWVTLRRKINGGSYNTVRQALYTYYDGTQAHGNLGDLMTAQIKDGNGNVLATDYYRYYTGEAGGYVHGLKYVFNSHSYDRLTAAFPTTWSTATDAQVAPYADQYYEYDTTQRVTKQVLQANGSSLAGGAGQGTFTFTYYLPSTNANGYNSWHNKTLETLPDGSTQTVYTNYIGEVMLQVFHDAATGNNWETFQKFDNSGRLILTAYSSALTGYDETKADLLNNVSGNYQYMSDNTGLVKITDYYASTTATETSAGGAAGYVEDTKLQQGEMGTPILQDSTQYFAHTGGGATVYPIASHTVYRNTDGTGGETTSYAYTWVAGTTRMQSETESRPIISASQNGPNTADVTTTYYDTFGRPIWTEDPSGFINYTAYDDGTGAITKTISDVDTTRTSDFQNLPAGWATPSGAGLHLITQMTVDYLGRTTKLIDPNGNITYTVYDDVNDAVRVYPGWQTATNTTTGPTQVTRHDAAGSYVETLTMTATPAVDANGVPTGAEAISNIQSLWRNYSNSAGQFVRRDDYFNLSGLTFSTAAYIGTAGTNYYSTLTDYDNRGRATRTVSPTGTITRTVYDGLGRVASVWVGTNDTPASGSWSPTNNTAPSNMVEVSSNVYDNGGVGDGDLTQVTQYPGGGAANRVTQYYYDWRNRLVATKEGVSSNENDGTHRPIIYSEYDNLGEVTATDQYDGDGVTITSTAGVPNKPSASLLRAYSTTEYDDQGRAFHTHVYSVDQSSGTISANSLTTAYWYDHRGNLIKTSQPGGLVNKTNYDGAGRVFRTFVTDGGGDATWADAGNVAGDAVLQQVDTTLDADGNPIIVLTRDRFHDETATGGLGTPTTSPKARMSYVTGYYDAANRLTATVNVGTNGGVGYARPATVPAGSDTVLVTSTAYSPAGWVQSTTDPRGIVTQNTYDNLGRVTKTVQAYTGGSPGSSSDVTTEYTYDASGHTLTVKADMAGGAYQTTQYIYGTTQAGGSGVNSNDLLNAINYPDKTTGNPSNSEKERFTVNALGQRTSFTDRNGTVHDYVYDVLGRQTVDAVVTLGSGVDGSVRRLTTAYDTGGRPYLYTSYATFTGGTIVNQVQDVYNGLGQLTTEYQSTSGAVNTSSTPNVQYAYSQMAGGANHSRLVSMTYPNGRVINYNYNTGLDDTISRLSSISDSSATLEAYSYLGVDTMVKRAHPQPGVDLTYIKQTGEANGDAGDQYTGIDRFGRVVDQRWLNSSTLVATDRFIYGYDRDGNPLYRDNKVNAAFGELYHANGPANGYDNLGQLTAFARGTLSDTNSDGIPDTVASPAHSQSWTLDALGNWSSVTTDGSTQTRTANQQNQITSISGQTTPVYDANGNMTTDQTGKTLIYDAWNRLVQVKSGSAVLEAYSYDSLGRRVTVNPGTLTSLYYSNAWQVVEEQAGGTTQAQYVWSPVYVDAIIERDRGSERFYVQQDANWNVTAIVDTTGNVQERYIYDPYGQTTVLDQNWNTRANSLYAWVYLHQGGRYDTATGLYEFRERDYSPTLGRWAQLDPVGLAAGDYNLYRYVGNRPAIFVDPIGLWSVTRNNNQRLAPATAEPGDTIASLATKIGLQAGQFRAWLTLESGTITLVNGGKISLAQLGQDDQICANQTVKVPNVVYAIWVGDLGWFGKLAVDWSGDLGYLRTRGFYVAESDGTANLLATIGAYSNSRTLHGLFVTGHGNVGGFGTKNASIWLNYSDIASALQYRLGLVILNVCGGSGGGGLGAASGSAIFYGIPGTLVPPFQTGHPSDFLKPGDQGTQGTYWWEYITG
jgi:RHS repeat-associated protein